MIYSGVELVPTESLALHLVERPIETVGRYLEARASKVARHSSGRRNAAEQPKPGRSEGMGKFWGKGRCVTN